MPSFSIWSLSVKFLHPNAVCTSPLPHTCYMPCPYHCSWFGDRNSIWCGLQIMKLLVILYVSLTSYTGLFKMTVGVLTTCHTQYTWYGSICVFLFNRTALQVFVTYLTGALYVHPLWFYRVILNDCRVLTTCHTQYTWDSSICIFFYLIEQHSKFLLHTLQVLYMCNLCDSTNTNKIIDNHRWHATDSLERTRLSCWCL
jgi:hypothetical protein